MIFLYWKIYTVLRRRARKSLNKKQAKTVDKKTLQNVIENTATTNICQSQPPAPVPTVKPTKDQDTNGSSDTNRNRKLKTAIAEEASVTYMATASDTQNDEEDEDDGDDDGPKSPTSDEAQDHVIENNRTIDFPLCNVEEDHPSCIVDGKSGYTAPSNVEVETQFGSSASTRDNYLSLPKRKFPGLKKSGSSKKKTTTSPRKSVTKFNFHMRQSKKKMKGSASSRREKRATKTLAIVLGKKCMNHKL